MATAEHDCKECGRPLHGPQTVLEAVQAGIDGMPFEEVADPEKRAFLIGYALTGSHREAEAESGVSRQKQYTKAWRDDAQFQELLPVAYKMSVDVLEDEAHRRGVLGVSRKVGWYKGEAGGEELQYSDTMLDRLLRARAPERFRDNSDVTVKGAIANIDLEKLSPAQLLRLADGESYLSVLGGAVAQLPTGRDVTPDSTA